MFWSQGSWDTGIIRVEDRGGYLSRGGLKFIAPDVKLKSDKGLIKRKVKKKPFFHSIQFLIKLHQYTTQENKKNKAVNDSIKN